MSEPIPVQTESPRLDTHNDVRIVLLWLIKVVKRLIEAVRDLDGGGP